MACELVKPVSDEVSRNAARSHGSVVSSSGLEDSDLADLRVHIQEMPSENEEILSCRAGNRKNSMEMLLELCTEIKKNGVLEAKKKCLTQQLPVARTAQKNCVVELQAMRDGVAAKEVTENRVLVVTEELKEVKTSRTQALLARTAEVDDLESQLMSAQKTSNDVEFERDEAKARLRQLQTSQQRYHATISLL